MLAALVCVASSACGGTVYTDDTTGQSVAASTDGWRPVTPVAVTLPTRRPVGPDRTTVPSASGPVVVNVWASFCLPCKRELPLLQKVSRQRGVRVVGLSRDVREKDATGALAAAGVRYPNWMDSDASFAVALDGLIPLNQIPSSVLMRGGKVVAVHIGPFRSVRDVLTGLDTAGR